MFSVDGYFGGEWEYYIPVDDSRRRTKRDRTKRNIRQASDAGPVGGRMMPIRFQVHGRGRFQENRPGFQGAHPRIDKSGNEFERMIPPDPGELNTQVCEFIKVNDQAKWNSIIGNRSKTSLSMG